MSYKYTIKLHLKKFLMGCVNSQPKVATIPLTPPLIPQPTGKPVDPLNSTGDIVDAITTDPHIEYYQKKIKEAIIQAKKKKQSKIQQQNNQKKQSKIYKKSAVQKYATDDKLQFKSYVETVNQALEDNSSSVTNILQFMIEQIGDTRDAVSLETKVKTNDQYAALKCFVYLYTGKYTYKTMNSQLRRNQYEKISKVIALVQKQLESYNKEKFARKLKANLKFGKMLSLHRGITRPDKDMIKGKRLYWKSFTSTSLSTSVAAKFGRYQYVIELETSSPHPYMIVPQQLTQFQQQQIILFPYFYFQCTNYQNFTSGARYQCKQLLPEE